MNSASALPALTLHQPWAEAIARGLKRIETRSWAPPAGLVGRRWAIAAGAKLPGAPGDTLAVSDGVTVTRQRGSVDWVDDGGSHACVLGCVVATAVLEVALPMIGPAMRPTGLPGSRRVAVDRWVEIGPGRRLVERRRDVDGGVDLSAEWAWGWFEPGRVGWLFADVEPVDPPVPAKGRQGVWWWDQDGQL